MNTILLCIITFIILFGVYKRVDVYSAFVEGAKEGIVTTYKIFPYMIALMVCISIFKTSGAINLIGKILAPVFNVLKIPLETLPLIILKPFSGGASVGILSDILKSHGADSYIGILSSVIMGSSETVFYTVSLYFGYVGVKNTRHTLFCALISTAFGVLGSILAVNLLF